MKTKTQIAVEAFTAGDAKAALKLASSFKMGITKQQSAVLKRGYECMTFPDTYRQMGKDPAVCVEAAKSLFTELFV